MKRKVFETLIRHLGCELEITKTQDLLALECPDCLYVIAVLEEEIAIKRNFQKHVEHRISLVVHGNKNISIECLDCSEVLWSREFEMSSCFCGETLCFGKGSFHCHICYAVREENLNESLIAGGSND